MQFFITDQVYVFLMAILCGLIIGLINEPFRFLRYMGINSTIAIFMQDIIFMAIIAFLSFFFSLCYNKGEVRFFILIGEFCGFLIFRYTIGLLTGKIFWLFRFCIKKVISLCKSIGNAISTIIGKFFAVLLVKIPLFKNSKETSCKKGENYCIILKSVFRFTKALKKR